MAYTKSNLRNVVYLSIANKTTLFNTGTLTIAPGETLDYSESDIYITPDPTGTASSSTFLRGDNT